MKTQCEECAKDAGKRFDDGSYSGIIRKCEHCGVCVHEMQLWHFTEKIGVEFNLCMECRVRILRKNLIEEIDKSAVDLAFIARGISQSDKTGNYTLTIADLQTENTKACKICLELFELLKTLSNEERDCEEVEIDS